MTKRLDMQAAAAYWARITGVPRPHRGTLIRWATKGVRGHRLQAEPLAGRWYTSEEAVEEFLRHMGEKTVATVGNGSPARAAQVERAVSDLDEQIARSAPGRKRSPK